MLEKDRAENFVESVYEGYRLSTSLTTKPRRFAFKTLTPFTAEYVEHVTAMFKEKGIVVTVRSNTKVKKYPSCSLSLNFSLVPVDSTPN